MPMTPQDIQSQQFHVRFRGFDAEEVDNFLEKVAEEYLVLMEENQELQNEIEKFRTESESYRARERTFQNAIMSAQQIAEEMKVKSRREAEEIIAAAKEEAHEIQKGANAEVAALESELDRLKTLKLEAGRELRQILRNYLAQLEEGFSGEQAPSASENQSEPAAAAEFGEETGPADEEQEAMVDLSELYERIDLSDEEITPAEGEEQPSEPAAEEEEVYDLFQEEQTETEKNTPESTVPDLEGEMLFTLEDPLDEGPAVSFEEEPEEDKKKEKE